MTRIWTLLLSLLTSSAALAAGEVTALIDGRLLQVALTSPDSYVAFQMDITLPAAARPGTPVGGERLVEGPPITIGGMTRHVPFQLVTHPVAADEALGTQTIRLLVYNLGLYPIADGDGPLFTLDLGADGLGGVTIDGIRFVEDYTYDEVNFPPLTLGTLTDDLTSPIATPSETSSERTIGLDGRAVTGPSVSVILRQEADGTVRKHLNSAR